MRICNVILIGAENIIITWSNNILYEKIIINLVLAIYNQIRQPVSKIRLYDEIGLC